MIGHAYEQAKSFIEKELNLTLAITHVLSIVHFVVSVILQAFKLIVGCTNSP